MPQPAIEDLPTEVLIKRKKFSGFVLGFVWTAAILSLLAVAYIFIDRNELATNVLVPALACIVISMPMQTGRKKIIAELKNREDIK